MKFRYIGNFIDYRATDLQNTLIIRSNNPVVVLNSPPLTGGVRGG